ncbi:MAG: YggS family pyridoxal phosphate-dependent enzyme, partial [Butyrivibrio sp.]|nr:YggS family pyridoxal phosphate-dependent enzyme [Butyrivibrio sp.]
MIKENLEYVEKNIRKACEKAGRKREDVTLIAVSKTKPVSDIREAMACGITVFGENKVQEIRDKTAEITEPLSWHMIGHLQANKVKYLPGVACMIHSVDNRKLADEIEKQAAKHDLVMDVLVEVNMAHEDTKFGLSPDEAIDFVKEISTLPHLNIRGFMTIAPYTEDPESNRVYFKGLRELKDQVNSLSIPGV